MKQAMIILLVPLVFVVVGVVIGLLLGIPVLVVVLFLSTALELLLDWFKRGKDYVSASRFNYVFKALIDVITVVVVGWFYLLPRHPVLWLAFPLLAISIPLVTSRFQLYRAIHAKHPPGA